jgi:metal-responsive CopG/Arc/MetJ family transcriptional regulator
MTEIKISVSDKLDSILQKFADKLGVKKAEFVKNIVLNYVIESENKEGKR